MDDTEERGFGQLERRLATIPLYRIRDLGLVGVDRKVMPWLGMLSRLVGRGQEEGRPDRGQGRGQGARGAPQGGIWAGPDGNYFGEVDNLENIWY